MRGYYFKGLAVFQLTLSQLEAMFANFNSEGVFYDRFSILDWLKSFGAPPAEPDYIPALKELISRLKTAQREVLNHDDWICLFNICVSIEAKEKNPATASWRAVSITWNVSNIVSRYFYSVACALAKYGLLDAEGLSDLYEYNRYGYERFLLRGRLFSYTNDTLRTSVDLSKTYFQWVMAVTLQHRINKEELYLLADKLFENPMPEIWMRDILDAQDPLHWTKIYFQLQPRLHLLPADFFTALTASPMPLQCAAAFFDLKDNEFLTPSLQKWLPTCLNPHNAMLGMFRLKEALIRFNFHKLNQLKEPEAFAHDLVLLKEHRLLTDKRKNQHFALSLTNHTKNFIKDLARIGLLTNTTYEIGRHFQFAFQVSYLIVDLKKEFDFSDGELESLTQRSLAWIHHSIAAFCNAKRFGLDSHLFARLLFHAENPEEFLTYYRTTPVILDVAQALKAPSPLRLQSEQQGNLSAVALNAYRKHIQQQSPVKNDEAKAPTLRLG